LGALGRNAHEPFRVERLDDSVAGGLVLVNHKNRVSPVGPELSHAIRRCKRSDLSVTLRIAEIRPVFMGFMGFASNVSAGIHTRTVEVTRRSRAAVAPHAARNPGDARRALA